MQISIHKKVRIDPNTFLWPWFFCAMLISEIMCKTCKKYLCIYFQYILGIYQNYCYKSQAYYEWKYYICYLYYIQFMTILNGLNGHLSNWTNWSCNTNFLFVNTMYAKHIQQDVFCVLLKTNYNIKRRKLLQIIYCVTNKRKQNCKNEGNGNRDVTRSLCLHAYHG